MQYVWLVLGLSALVLLIIQITLGSVRESIPMAVVCFLAIIFYFVRRKQANAEQKQA